MAFSNSARRIVTSITGTFLIALSSTAFAANPPAMAPSIPAKLMREKMAFLYEQMAACLRSDKSMAECRAEMQKNCHDIMGNRGCTMTMIPNTPSSSSSRK